MATFSIFALAHDLNPDQRLIRRRMLARLGLAWLLMMQVMMLAFPAYLREAPAPAAQRSFLDDAIIFMNWISLLLTLPVVWYCAAPVWQGAWTRMRAARITMDVPVALGIFAAFIPSVYATWVQHGEVYFESVCMFVAFLLTARYLELCASQASDRVVGKASASGFDHARFKQTLRQRADRIAVWFTLLQIVLSLLVGAIWFIYQPEHAVAVMVAMLVISCPCALAMAVPVSIAAGQARLAAQGAQSHAEIIWGASEQVERQAGATVRDGLQGANRSDSRSYHEDLQRGRAPESVDACGAVTCSEAPWQTTERCARQNLYGALIWHVLMMPLAAAGWVQPWLAALTMLASSLAVAGNGWRHFSAKLS